MKWLKNLFSKKENPRKEPIVSVQIIDICPNCLGTVCFLKKEAAKKGITAKDFDIFKASIALHEEKLNEFIQIAGIELAQILLDIHVENDNFELAAVLFGEMKKYK